VALLSTKSEYMALFQTSTKVIWIRRLLASLDLKNKNPTIIHLDNQSLTTLIENLKFDARNKHIDVQIHFVKEQVQAKDIKLNINATPKIWLQTFLQKLYQERSMNIV
jgi:hypothetical protein